MIKGSNTTIRSHRDLHVYAKAYEVTLRIYALTKTFPPVERFGLALQMRRCAVSIPSNIAEGYGRGTAADYARFLRIARGSLCELDTQLSLAHDLGYLTSGQHSPLLADMRDCSKMLNALIRSIEAKVK